MAGESEGGAVAACSCFLLHIGSPYARLQLVTCRMMMPAPPSGHRPRLQAGEMLEKRGLPPTLSLLAESLLDGRLPPRSIAWLKIETIALNIRQDYIRRWRYPEQLYQLMSQALKYEGARAAVNLLRGPCAARRSEQFKRGVPTFVNVNTSRSNDPSIMTHQAVRTRDKSLYEAERGSLSPGVHAYSLSVFALL